MATPFLLNFKYYSQVNLFKYGDKTIQKLGVSDEVKRQTNLLFLTEFHTYWSEIKYQVLTTVNTHNYCGSVNRICNKQNT